MYHIGSDGVFMYKGRLTPCTVIAITDSGKTLKVMTNHASTTWIDKDDLYPLPNTHHEKEGDNVENNMVEHPAHYNVNGIEVINVIEAYNLSFNLGNICKYILRSGRKDNRLQDLQKAKWYLDREIQKLSE